MSDLSPRQIELLAYMARTGKTRAEVGEDFSISEQTVKNTLTGAYRKLRVRGAVEAYIALGWLTVPEAPA